MTDFRIPPKLRKGTTIGVVAPASPPHRDRALDEGVSVLEGLGYSVRVGSGAFERNGYLSGTDEQRARDINEMFANPEIAAIFCTRGGYGSGRILPLLDYSMIRKNPKILVGYSDITSLSMALLRACRLVSFAGPMVVSDFARGADAFSLQSLFSLLTSTRAPRRIVEPPGDAMLTMCPGRAEGRLIGGNFATLMSLIGTPYEPRWGGAILFLEDVAENAYKIDRMLMQLRNMGVLTRLAGVLLGSFTNIPEDVPDRTLESIFLEYFLPLRIPVIQNVPFGHRTPKSTLPFGALIRIDGKGRTITLLQAVVR